jgi:hypothetical protein
LHVLDIIGKSSIALAIGHANTENQKLSSTIEKVKGSTVDQCGYTRDYPPLLSD